MSNSLYEDAIAEARRLTEMAEQNAKNKIIDAVTPQIRQLIEQELAGVEGDEELEIELDDAPEEEGDQALLDLDALAGMAGMADDLVGPEADEEEAETSLRMSDGEIEVQVGDVSIEIETGADDDEEEVLLDQPMAEALAGAVAGTKQGRRRLNERLHSLQKRVRVLKEALQEAKKSSTPAQREKIAAIMESLAHEAVTLQRQAIISERNTGGRTLETKLVSSIIKEMKEMSRKNGKSVFDFLFEAEEGEDMEQPEAEAEEVEVEEAGEVEVDADAVASAVEDILAAVGAADMEVEVSGGEEAEEEAEEAEEAEIELDLEEGDMMEMQHEMDEGEHMDETVYELDESMLRRELRRLRRLNEADAVDGSGDSSFGGGEAGDEAFVEVDEETLLNVLADELGDVAPGKASAEADSFGGGEMQKENRMLKRQVVGYRRVIKQLKGHLSEMNLFNAKLLYTTKLIQNRDFTAKQQRAIVEALENAKTLREAKLLYKSLTESLDKGANGGRLAENRKRVLGSASKSARSAQPVNESGGDDRWALLAGLKNN